MGVPLNVTEWMKGYVGFGVTDYDAGFLQGLDRNTYFTHDIAIEIGDIDRFVAEPTHAAAIDGFITCDALGGRRPVAGGTFNMLVDGRQPTLQFMFYRLPFTDGNGAPYTMLGHKTLHDDHSLDLWSDVTTLSLRLFAGDVPGPDVTTPSMGPGYGATQPAAMGILHIEVLDGFRSARSFQSPGANPLQAADAVAKFGKFYMRNVWQTFGKAAARP